MDTYTRRISVICGAIALMASIAHAQDIPTSFDQLRVLVKPGDTVTVTDGSGGVMQGRILDLSSATLGLQVDGQRREFSADDVRTIRQRRHANLATGAKWGFGIGTGFGLFSLAAATRGDRCDGCLPLILIGSAFYGGMGAGIGVGVAAAIVRPHVIFARPDASVKLSVSPMVGRERTGIMLTARW
jgi:hypothetical protein